MKSLSVAMLNKYEEMVNARFDPLIKKAEAAANILKAGIRDEIRKEWGIDRLTNKIMRLEEQLKLAKEQLADLVGGTVSGWKGNSWESTSDQKLEAEVDRRLIEKDGFLFVLQKMKKDMVEKVWLMTAPPEMAAFVQEINQMLPALEDKVQKIKLIE